jgi:hypothetical protein
MPRAEHLAPARYDFARDVLASLARERPDARALLWGGPGGKLRERSFAGLVQAAARAAPVLAGASVERAGAVLVRLGGSA